MCNFHSLNDFIYSFNLEPDCWICSLQSQIRLTHGWLTKGIDIRPWNVAPVDRPANPLLKMMRLAQPLIGFEKGAKINGKHKTFVIYDYQENHTHLSLRM